MTNNNISVVIDGNAATHSKQPISHIYRDVTISVTLCGVWFAEQEAIGAVPLSEPRGQQVQNPVDCMTCLVVEARS